MGFKPSDQQESIGERERTRAQVLGAQAASAGSADLTRVFKTLDTANFTIGDYFAVFEKQRFPWQQSAEQTVTAHPTSGLTGAAGLLGNQLVINEEQQYYLTKAEIDLLKQNGKSDAFGGSGNPTPRYPWFVKDGRLVLRCVPTPADYQDVALGWLANNQSDFQVESATATSTSLTLFGEAYYDVDIDKSRYGLNRYLRDELTPDAVQEDAIKAHRRGLMSPDQRTRFDFNGDGQGTLTALRKKMRYPHGFFMIESRIYRYRSLQEPVDDSPFGSANRSKHVLTLSAPLTNGDLAKVKSGTKVRMLRHLPYLSGMLTTQGKHAQKFGSWEMKARLPDGAGTFAALWAWPNYSLNPLIGSYDNKQKNTEIDFVEQPGHAPIAYHNAHQPFENMLNRYGTRKWNKEGMHMTQVLIPPSDPEFVDFARTRASVVWDWYPNHDCTWFVATGSGLKETRSVPLTPQDRDNVIDERMVILNNAFDGKFNRTQENVDRQSTSFPFRGRTSSPWDLEIDFVRVYQWKNLPDAKTGYQDPGSGAYANSRGSALTYLDSLSYGGGGTGGGTGTGGTGTGGTTAAVTGGTRYDAAQGEIFWNKGSYTQFNVYRGGVLQNGSPINASSFYQGNLTGGTSYAYEVRAVDGGSSMSLGTITLPASAGSGTLGGGTGGGGAGGSGGTAAVSGGTRYDATQGEIFWNKGSYTQFKVYRNGALVTANAISAASFYQNTLVGGTSYTYEVRAVDGGGSVNLGTVTLPGSAGAGTVGGGGSGTSGAAVTSGTRYDATQGEIFWNKGSYTQFKVYRNGTLVTANAINAASFYQNNLVGGTSYTYEVKAVDGGGSVSLGTVTLPGAAGSGTVS